MFDRNNQILGNLMEIVKPIHSPYQEFFHTTGSFRVDVQTHVSLLTQISKTIESKFSEILVDTKRQKRGLVNGIGTFFKAITGNLDAEDGQFFTDSINKLNQNQLQVETLLKNQISVTSSVIKTFNETVNKLQINEKTFNDDINQIDLAIHQLNDDIAMIQAKLSFFELCEKLMESFLFLEDNLNDIINSITFARLNILHSSILSPDHLIAALQEISQNLVKNNLPLPVRHSNVAQYLEIIELEAFQTNSDLVFVLRIPLVEQQLYTVFHLYPIPIYDDRTGLHHILSFSQKYIARNDDSLMYIPIKDMSACKRLGPREKLCSELYAFPIDSSAMCEAQLLKNFQSVPENCQSSTVLSEGYNVHRLETNTWLVTVSEPIRATINCPDIGTKTLALKINSIVKLQPDCSAFVGITKIQTEPQKTSNISDNSHPVLIPYDCCENIPEKVTIPNLKPLKLDNINMEDLNVANHKLEQYSRDLDQLINQPFVTRNISWFTYGTIAVIICLLTAYSLFQFWKRSRNNTATSRPVSTTRNTILRIIPKLRRNLKPEEENDVEIQETSA